MGQGLFQYPTPDGYPDKEAPWLGTLLWRWNFALALASNRLDAGGIVLQPSAVSIDALARAIGGTEEKGLNPSRLVPHFIGRSPVPHETGPLADYIAANGLEDEHKAEFVGLILASPAFQWH